MIAPGDPAGASIAAPAGRLVRVHATNYDGSDHWQHPAALVRATSQLVVTATRAGQEVQRENGIYISPFHTNGHYWPDRWFNVIRLEEPASESSPGRLSGFYCNIASPVRFDGERVRYVDLQLDVRVFADEVGGLRCEVLDEDEFEEARRRYAYPADLVERCHKAVEELMALVEARAFPFDR